MPVLITRDLHEGPCQGAPDNRCANVGLFGPPRRPGRRRTNEEYRSPAQWARILLEGRPRPAAETEVWNARTLLGD
jgi:hypothetical protein